MEEKRTESEIRAAVEAILFAAGDSVENERLAEALELDKQEMNDILKRMALRLSLIHISAEQPQSGAL